MTERANHEFNASSEYRIEGTSAEGTSAGGDPQTVADSVSDEPLLARLRISLWLQHQPAIAGLLLACVVGMSVYFVHRNHVHNGLIEIDRSGSLKADFQVDINEAGFGEIVILPGVGKKLAQTIVDYRHQTGPFDSVESLTEVPGIGEKKLEALIPYLTPIKSD